MMNIVVIAMRVPFAGQIVVAKNGRAWHSLGCGEMHRTALMAEKRGRVPQESRGLTRG